MTYTTTELITDAWHESGIVSRGLATPSLEQITDGLQLLNGLLSFQGATGRLIPYFQTYPLTGVIAQELYFVPNLIEVEAMTFNIGVVRFPSVKKRRKRYFGTGRANNVNSLPVSWHAERTLGGMNLYFYFMPNQTYPINLIGKFALLSTALNDDLSTIYDLFYIDYLKYSLTKRMCASYAIALPPQVQQLLSEYTQSLLDLSPIDFSLEKQSTLQRGAGLSYAQINLGGGWVPS